MKIEATATFFNSHPTIVGDLESLHGMHELTRMFAFARQSAEASRDVQEHKRHWPSASRSRARLRRRCAGSWRIGRNSGNRTPPCRGKAVDRISSHYSTSRPSLLRPRRRPKGYRILREAFGHNSRDRGQEGQRKRPMEHEPGARQPGESS